MIIESQTDKHIYPAGNGQAVAIIGLGALFPGGRPGIAGYWSLVKNGRDAITDIPADHFLADDYFDPDPKARDRIYCRRGAFIPSVLFSPLKYGVTPKDLETIDSTQLLGLVIADEALRDAGYPTESHDNSRTAVIMGVTGALKMVVSLGSRLVHPQLRRALAECGIGPEMADKVLDRFAGKFPPWKESSFPGLLGNVTAGRVANRLDLGGPNMVVDAACASSLAAISQALAALRSGKADLVVSGGLDTFNDPFMFSCFSKTPALSPSGEVRSFDRQGDGTLLGEGVGIVVLKRLDEAIRDGDKIYASIASVGGSSDGKGTAVFAPSPSGQRRAIEAAYMEAGWHPSEVELVEAHGTGTAVGDEVELTALGYFFSSGDKGLAGDSQAPGPWCALGSVKSQIGHTKGAAGVAGLIKATLALHHKVLPPTIKVTEPLEPLTKNSFPLYLNDRARPWLSAPGRPRRAAVSAFGFGGSNFHCLLSEAPGPKPAESHPETHLAPLSADSPEALLEKLASFVSSLGQTDSDQAIDSLGRGLRGSFNHQDSERLILVGQPRDIRLMANKALEALKAGQRVPSIKGLHYGHGNAPVEPMGLWLPAMPGNPVVTAATIGRLGPALMDLGMAFPGIMSLLDLAEGLRAKYKLSNYNLGLILSPPALAPSAIKTGLHSELARPGVASLLWGLTQIAMAELAKGFRAQVTSIRREGLGNLACLCHSSLLGAEEALALAIELGRGSDRENLLAKLSKYVSDPGNTSQGPFGGLYPSAEACLKALLGEFPEGDFPDVGPLDSAPSPSQDNGTGNLSLAEIRLAGSSWQSFLSPDDPLRNLAETLARAASMGYAIDFKAWPGWPEEPEVPSGYAVPIGGANLFREPEPMPAKPLALQESQGLKGSLADAGALSQTLSEILLNQREGLSLLKSLAQPQAPGASPWPVASEALGKPPSFMASQMADSLPQGGLAGDGQLWPGQAPGFPDIEMPGPPAAGALKVSGGNGKSASFGLASPDLTGAVWERLAGIVSEETGYPAEALAPELELENDLGLDSIKKVELLSLLSEIFPSLSGAGPDLGQSLTLGELARLCESAISSPGQGAQGQDQ
ncbi:MAG: phosphopantetheine-binding protein, partial [Deltaproteobacteria bacterium]|nr:phosphopantetheine-binding protein [Deltaproteobacteria bacterium]